MITVIIPARDEERTIGKVIEDVRLNLPRAEILVIDNGSQDSTLKITKESGARAIKEPQKGKGNAMKAGAKAARGNTLVFIDGDGSYPASHIPELVKFILEKNEDIVYGSRFLPRSKIEMKFSRYVGNKIFSFLGSLLYIKVSDFLTGLFTIKRNRFLELNLKSQGFEVETEIFTKAVKNKLNIKEVPIEYKKGTKSKLNSIVDGLKIIGVLLRNKILTNS